jgi:hypothetical protein
MPKQMIVMIRKTAEAQKMLKKHICVGKYTITKRYAEDATIFTYK